MKLIILTGFAAILAGATLASGSPFSSQQKLTLRGAVANRESLARYDTFELTLDLSPTYENPFDPEQINIEALFTSPAGKQVQVNGFLDQPFTRKLQNNAEKIEAAGDRLWKIRFTPDAVGRWTYSVRATDRSGTASLPESHFEVVASQKPGFIRRSQQNPRGFAWDNGSAYFPIGENMCWGGGRGSFDYEDWLPELSKAGGNFIRIWMCSWNCALEWAEESKGEQRNGSYHGVGVYSLDNAWKLDTILYAAERNGISVMLCLGTYGEFNEGGYFNEGQWKANPYNAANGGPCARPEDFWTNATARKLYQRRLRYLAARYGHRTNLQSWEFWNEAKAPAPWVAEMARFLKGTGEFNGQAADPYGHLVTTTYGDADVWKIPEIDFAQTHSYGTGNIADHAPVIISEAAKHAAYGKPHLMGEFGIDWRSPDNKYDPDGKGLNLHNALWASAVSGDAGGAMIWWWDNYVHPKKLYGAYTPLKHFTDEVPWATGEWKKLTATCSSGSGNSVTNSAEVRVYGLINDRMAIAWVQNSASTWKNVYEKKEVPIIPAAMVHFREIPPGRYLVRWWDTHTGEIVKRESVNASNGEVNLAVPVPANDRALILSPQNQ
jgi:Domain of unknown function (DUF5060)